MHVCPWHYFNNNNKKNKPRSCVLGIMPWAGVKCSRHIQTRIQCINPAAALGRVSPRHVKLQCLGLIAAFLCRLRCAPARPRPRLCWHAFACLPGPPSMHAWLLRLWIQIGSDFAPERLPAPDPVMHVSAPVRRGAVADARLGLA